MCMQLKFALNVPREKYVFPSPDFVESFFSCATHKNRHFYREFLFNIKELQNTLIALWKCFNNSILDVLSSALAYVFFQPSLLFQEWVISGTSEPWTASWTFFFPKLNMETRFGCERHNKWKAEAQQMVRTRRTWNHRRAKWNLCFSKKNGKISNTTRAGSLRLKRTS